MTALDVLSTVCSTSTILFSILEYARKYAYRTACKRLFQPYSQHYEVKLFSGTNLIQMSTLDKEHESFPHG